MLTGSSTTPASSPPCSVLCPRSWHPCSPCPWRTNHAPARVRFPATPSPPTRRASDCAGVLRSLHSTFLVLADVIQGWAGRRKPALRNFPSKGITRAFGQPSEKMPLRGSEGEFSTGGWGNSSGVAWFGQFRAAGRTSFLRRGRQRPAMVGAVPCPAPDPMSD